MVDVINGIVHRFLLSSDEINSLIIREFEEGKNGEATDPTATAAASAGAASEESKQTEEVPIPVAVSVSTSAKASITTPIARFAMNKPTTEPPPFEFTVEHPSGLNALDVDIIKLTAQYTVANGKDFLLGLAKREQRNPQFDFLKPTHMLFSYFTTLVDAYAKVLQPSTEQMDRLRAKKDRMKALESSVHRWEWTRSEEERKKKDAVHVDEERSAFQSIDWFDFTVVETIDFAEDELFEQPTQKVLVRVEEDDDMDMDEDDDDDQIRSAANQRMEMPPPPPMTTTNNSYTSSSSSSYSAVVDINNEPEGDEADSSKYGGNAAAEDMEMDTESEMYLNVVSDYTPRMANSDPTSGPMTMVDPISGKVIPVDEMSEHMRVQLMDPRLRIEQKRFQEKQRETGYAEGGSIADSLKQFAKKRGDIFGQKEPVSAQLEEDKKNAEQSVQWDGHMASIPQMQQLKNEMAARAPQVVVTAASVLPAIGPTIPGLGPQAPRIISLPTPVPMAAIPLPLPPPIISTMNYPIGIVPLPPPPFPVISLPVPLPVPVPIPAFIPIVAPPPILAAMIPSSAIPVQVQVPGHIPDVLDSEEPLGKKPRTNGVLEAVPVVPLGILCN